MIPIGPLKSKMLSPHSQDTNRSAGKRLRASRRRGSYATAAANDVGANGSIVAILKNEVLICRLWRSELVSR
jgi:hypothetical protein